MLLSLSDWGASHPQAFLFYLPEFGWTTIGKKLRAGRSGGSSFRTFSRPSRYFAGYKGRTLGIPWKCEGNPLYLLHKSSSRAR